MCNIRLSITLIAATLLLGCASNPPPPPPPSATAPPQQQMPRMMTTEEQLAELRRVVVETASAPRLGKSDVLSISVYDEQDLGVRGIPVRPDGKISFPLIGDVQAEGLTVDELSETITERLRQYVLAPKVSVIVQEFNSLNYTIYGEVVRPGVYPLARDVTIA